jgi:hypothetical protein
MDSLVKIVSVKDQPGFNTTTLQPMNTKVVTYTVGDNGPFTLYYPAGAYTQEAVQADIQREVDTLRGIGAIPASAGY